MTIEKILECLSIEKLKDMLKRFELQSSRPEHEAMTRRVIKAVEIEINKKRGIS